MALEIIRSAIDSNSGHVTCQVRVREQHSDGSYSYGPMEVVGIAHESLTTAHGCPLDACEQEVTAAVRRWLAQHHEGALARKRALERRSGVVAGLAGRVLEFDPENADEPEPAPEPAPAAPPEPALELAASADTLATSSSTAPEAPL